MGWGEFERKILQFPFLFIGVRVRPIAFNGRMRSDDCRKNGCECIVSGCVGDANGKTGCGKE